MGKPARRMGAQNRLLQVIDSHEERLDSLERRDTIEIWGTRTDDPEGDGSNEGVRVRVGELSDGTFGIERYTSTGTRQTPTWS